MVGTLFASAGAAADGPVSARAPEWPTLPRAALEGVKSRKKIVLSIHLGSASDAKVATNPSLSFASRAAIAVSPKDADDLMAVLTAPVQGTEFPWNVWRHDGLRVAALPGLVDATEELQAVAGVKPHVVAVRAGALSRGGVGLATALASFSGAVLVVLDQAASKVSKPLKILGIDSIWNNGADASSPLACVPIPKPKLGTVLADLKVKKLLQDPAYAALVEAAEPVYEHYFQSSFSEDVVKWEDSLVAFLVDDSEKPNLLGFIVYKFWPSPLRVASVLRVAVPAEQQGNGYGKQLVHWLVEKARKIPRHSCNKVTLTAVASAVAFYERLHFVQTPVEEEEEESENIDPDSIKMHYKLGRAYVPPRKR